MQVLIIYENKIGMKLYKTGEEALCTGRLTRLICISSSLHLNQPISSKRVPCIIKFRLIRSDNLFSTLYRIASGSENNLAAQFIIVIDRKGEDAKYLGFAFETITGISEGDRYIIQTTLIIKIFLGITRITHVNI